MKVLIMFTPPSPPVPRKTHPPPQQFSAVIPTDAGIRP